MQVCPTRVLNRSYQRPPLSNSRCGLAARVPSGVREYLTSDERVKDYFVGDTGKVDHDRFVLRLLVALSVLGHRLNVTFLEEVKVSVSRTSGLHPQ